MLQSIIDFFLSKDMLQNILAEFIGMAVTLFVVDIWIKRREEKRWLPAKNFLYSKLFVLANDFLVHFIHPKYWKIDSVAYYFGETEVMIGYEVDSNLLPELIEDNFSLSKSIPETGFSDTETLEKIRNEIKELFSNSIELIEPELLSQLFDFENALTFALKVDEMSKTDESVKVSIEILEKLMSSASLVRLWLLKKATRKISLEKLIEEQINTINDIQNQKKRLLVQARSRKTKTG